MLHSRMVGVMASVSIDWRLETNLCGVEPELGGGVRELNVNGVFELHCALQVE